MHRRDALKNVAILLGGALSASTMSILLDGCTHSDNKSGLILFSSDQEKMLIELADIIIPTTSSPGAKVAKVGPFISMMINECFPNDVQKLFINGLANFEKLSASTYNKSFLELTRQEQEKLVSILRDETLAQKKKDTEQAEKDKAANKEPKKTHYFFAILWDLTLLGYFTSEIGLKQAYSYIEIPGRYDGCVDLKPNQKVWA